MTARALNRRERRLAAKQLTRADTDVSKVIVGPPSPAHDHWWHSGERRWYRHDDRVLAYIALLRECDDDEQLEAIDTEIRRQLADIEP